MGRYIQKRTADMHITSSELTVERFWEQNKMFKICRCRYLKQFAKHKTLSRLQNRVCGIKQNKTYTFEVATVIVFTLRCLHVNYFSFLTDTCSLKSTLQVWFASFVLFAILKTHPPSLKERKGILSLVRPNHPT